MTFSWCKFGFGKCFGTSSWSSHWAGHCQLSYKIHFSLHVMIWLRNGSLLLCWISEDNTSKRFLDLWSAHKAPTYWAFSLFQLASSAKWPQNGQHWVLWQLLMWLSADQLQWWLSVGRCQLPKAGHRDPHLQGSHPWPLNLKIDAWVKTLSLHLPVVHPSAG